MGFYNKDKVLLKQIALKIKALRRSRGLTQSAVYEDTGLHIGRIETGNTDVSISNLKKLCDYFEIGLSDFFEGL